MQATGTRLFQDTRSASGELMRCRISLPTQDYPCGKSRVGSRGKEQQALANTITVSDDHKSISAIAQIDFKLTEHQTDPATRLAKLEPRGAVEHLVYNTETDES